MVKMLSRIYRFSYTSVKVLLVLLLYIVSINLGIFIIGFSNIGSEPISDIMRIGSSIISVQEPWRFIVISFTLCIYIKLYLYTKKQNSSYVGFKPIVKYQYPVLIVFAIILNFCVSKMVSRWFPSSTDTSSHLRLLVGNYPLLLIINSGIITPILEEIIFRFFIYNYIKDYGKWVAVILSSILFGLMHGNLTQCMSAICFGIVFCLVNEKNKSIVPSIVMHCGNNISTIILVMLIGGVSGG